jgi:hypothetical protein
LVSVAEVLARMTDKARLLELLSDGKPHSHKEAYRLGVMAHSRASDLRGDGYVINTWREGKLYWYQLVGAAPSAENAEGGASGPPDAPEGLASLPLGQEGVGAAAAPSDSQLALDVPGEHMYRRDAA